MFDFLNSSGKNKDQIKGYLQNLGALAASDGKLSKSEVTLLYRAGKKNGIKPDEVKEIIKDDSLTYTAPDNDEARFNQLFDFIVMIMSDGEVKEKEVDLCKELAEKTGIRKAACSALVDIIIKRIKEGYDKDSIRNEVSNFLYISAV